MAARRPRKSKWDVPSTDSNDNSANGNLSATDAAKAKAAKLNAMLAAQGKLAKGTPPPSVGHPSPAARVTAPPLQINNGNKNLTQDLLTAEVEINDSPARTFLCRGTTQDEINRYSGAAVSTRGKFMSEQEKMEAEGTGVKPLYLCIQGLTQEKVDLAVKRIREIMAGADVNAYPPSQPQRMPVSSPVATPSFNQPPAAIFDRQPLPAGMHYVQDKVFVGLDNTLPEFNLKEKLQGPGGSYFQHISTQTGAKVQLRGRGSGFIEPTSGKEAFEALYIYISHSKVDGLGAAKKLVENLIQTVHTEYKAFEQTRRPHYGYSPYMNAVGNPVSMGQPPSAYQPSAYGYPRPPPHGNGYPQPAQPPPGPGYPYNHPHHTARHQPPPPVRHGPPHPLPPRYGPPPPAAGYGNHPPPMAPPARGPAPYHGFPPGPHHQGVPPSGPSPPGPHPEAPLQAPPPGPPQPPLMENEYQTEVSGSSPASYLEKSQGGTSQFQEPPRRKFTEKSRMKASSTQDHSAASGSSHQDSSISNLGEAAAVEGRQQPVQLMPPPPGLPVMKTKPKEHEFTPPIPLKDAVPVAVASSRSRVAAGKREAAPVSQPAAVSKKAKTGESSAAKPSAIASLAAYGEDSSDEEESLPPDDKKDVVQSKVDRGSRGGATRRPFWAVR